MPKITRPILDNACYHILTRGNRKQNVFAQEQDYDEYLKRLKYYKRKHRFKLYGYCLMPNHVHLFGEIKQKGDLAKFMHDINRSYTAYFNETYNKVGHLWQGRFKSKVVVKDEYLINCINYVELNPVRVSMVRVPHEYKWSSYMERSLSTKKRRLLDSLIL
ncbi:MAG: transposase [Candidatus Hodarchaeales archaeon]